MAEKPKSQAHLWWIFIGLCFLGLTVNSIMSPAQSGPVAVQAPPDPAFGAPPEHVARVYAKDYLEAHLKDYDSMKGFEAQGPTPHTVGSGKSALRGYLVTFQFNAKNGFGAYTGMQSGALLIRNERVVWAAPIQ